MDLILCKTITEINHNLVERLPSMTSEKKQRKKNATARRTPIFLHGKTGFMFTVQVFQLAEKKLD